MTEMTQNISGHKKQTPFLKKKNLKSLHVRIFILGIRQSTHKIEFIKAYYDEKYASIWKCYMMIFLHDAIGHVCDFEGPGWKHKKYKKSCIRVLPFFFFFFLLTCKSTQRGKKKN